MRSFRFSEGHMRNQKSESLTVTVTGPCLLRIGDDRASLFFILFCSYFIASQRKKTQIDGTKTAWQQAVLGRETLYRLLDFDEGRRAAALQGTWVLLEEDAARTRGKSYST